MTNVGEIVKLAESARYAHSGTAASPHVTNAAAASAIESGFWAVRFHRFYRRF